MIVTGNKQEYIIYTTNFHNYNHVYTLQIEYQVSLSFRVIILTTVPPYLNHIYLYLKVVYCNTRQFLYISLHNIYFHYFKPIFLLDFLYLKQAWGELIKF